MFASHGRLGLVTGLLGLAVAAALSAAGPTAAQVSPAQMGPAPDAQVQVHFARPLAFTDAGGGAGPGPSFRGTLREFADILTTLGRRYLRPGESLDLTVLDLNVAGIAPFGYGVAGGPRIVTGATPPRIRLAYVLRRDGRATARGVDTVTDPNFLLTQNPKFSAGPLYYERRVLTDWFEERFKYRHGPGAAG